MPTQQDQVYTISDEDILESMRRELESRKAPRGVPQSHGSGKVMYDKRPSPTMVAPTGSARALAAATFSMFICGSGQAYNRQGKLGLLMFLTQAFAVAAHWSLAQLWPSLRELGDLFSFTEWRMLLTLAAADLLFIIFMLAGIYQAYRHAETETGGFEGSGNPVLAGLASLLVPGWGQLVNAQAGKAMVFLFCLMSGLYVAALLMLTPFLKLLESVDSGQLLAQKVEVAAVAVLITGAVMWVLSVYDAILVAGFRRKMA